MMGIRRGTRGASRETGPKNIFSRVSERTSIDRDKRIGGKGITGQIGKKTRWMTHSLHGLWAEMRSDAGDAGSGARATVGDAPRTRGWINEVFEECFRGSSVARSAWLRHGADARVCNRIVRSCRHFGNACGNPDGDRSGTRERGRRRAPTRKEMTPAILEYHPPITSPRDIDDKTSSGRGMRTSSPRRST